MKAPTTDTRKLRRAWTRAARMRPRVRIEPERSGELEHVSGPLRRVLARIEARRERSE